VDRAELDVDTLLKILLVLLVVWIGLEVVEGVLGIFAGLLGPLQPLLGFVLIGHRPLSHRPALSGGLLPAARLPPVCTA